MCRHGPVGFVRALRVTLQRSMKCFTLIRNLNLNATAVIYVNDLSRSRYGHIPFFSVINYTLFQMTQLGQRLLNFYALATKAWPCIRVFTFL